MAELFAFFGDDPVGVFTRGDDGTVGFAYHRSYGATPLSLSLPIGGGHAPWAPAHFLDNLLPDNPKVRARWQAERALPDAEPFTLLAEYGEDVAGALTLSPHENLPERAPDAAVEASEDDIAARIASLSRESTSWLDPRARPRMSLAGAQGKFSLAEVNDRWFWPTYRMPSTHIFKPVPTKIATLATFENTALRLAGSVGVEASESTVVEFRGQRAFLVRRWDRARGARIHSEDLNQALGVPAAGKYGVAASAIARLLAEHQQEWRFVRQLAFNVALGNGDAHAKNYSVLLNGDAVRLAPLYDSVPTFFYPQFDNRFAMKIGQASFPAELSDKNWHAFARESDLDPERVVAEASTVVSGVREHFADTFGPLVAQTPHLSEALRRHLKVLSRLAV